MGLRLRKNQTTEAAAITNPKKLHENLLAHIACHSGLGVGGPPAAQVWNAARFREYRAAMRNAAPDTHLTT